MRCAGVVRLLGVGATLLAAGVLAAGCGGSGSGSGSGGEKGVRVAVFGRGPNSFVDAEVRGVRSVVDKTGGSVTYFPSVDGPTQRRQVEDAVTTARYDAFVISPIDQTGILPAVKKAVASGIKVVSFNNPIGPSLTTLGPQVDGVVGSAMVTPEHQADHVAEAIVSACRGDDTCNVGFLNISGKTPFDLAYDDVLKRTTAEHPNMHVVDVEATGLVKARGLAATRTMLLAHPDLDVIASIGDQASAGAYQQLESAGLADRVKVIGAGASDVGVAGVRSRRWYATALLLPQDEGAAAGRMAVQAVTGRKVSPDAVDVLEETRYPIVMTRDNLDRFRDFEAQWTS